MMRYSLISHRNHRMNIRVDILSFEEWIPSHQKEKATAVSNLQKRKREAPPYDSTKQETRPDHPFFTFPKTAIDKWLLELHDLVASRTSHAREEDTELMGVRDAAHKISEIAAWEGIDIPIIGDSGMGKSTLINAALDQDNLAASSAMGSAKTASNTKFAQKHGAQARHKLYDAIVQFLDDRNLEEVIDEHIRRYFYWHFAGKGEDELSDDDELAQQTALDFFELIFNTINDKEAEAHLKALLTSTGISNGYMRNAALEKAKQQMEKAGADADNKVVFQDMSLEVVKKEVERFLSQTKDKDRPAMWHLVSLNSLLLDSLVTRNGVNLTDSAGKFSPRVLLIMSAHKYRLW